MLAGLESVFTSLYLDGKNGDIRVYTLHYWHRSRMVTAIVASTSVVSGLAPSPIATDSGMEN